ncbi:MAG: hypothetical protein ABR987_03890 [Terracidiphilus sp.]|jgi:hypothetical protein
MTERAQLPKIFVDFNNADEQGRIRLNTVGTIRDLSRLEIVLREDAELLLSSYELEVEGRATYSDSERIWVASIDWNKVRELH